MAIREPAVRRGVSVERALVEKLIADTREEPGALPLLQETLRSLWEKRERDGALWQGAGDSQEAGGR